MFPRFPFAGFALAALAALQIAGTAAAQHPTPFVGRLQGTVAVTPVSPLPPAIPIIVKVEVQATGNATHLGLFTVAVPHLVDRSTFTAAGSYQFKAADGSLLTSSFTQGKSMPTGIPGVISIVEPVTITGGTGRFLGASGSFTCLRTFNMNNGTTVGSFTGTIVLRSR